MERPALTGRHRILVTVALLALTVFVLWRTAWVSDDAFITLRTVDNALNGHGLRWNVAERVQTYTHPAWMLLLLVTHRLTGEPWFGTMLLGATTTLAALGLLLWRAKNGWVALAAVLPLLASKAWIDFATSGLENPLTHLLLIGAVLSLERGGDRPRDVGRTALIVGLALTNRLDAAVLFTPLLLSHASSAPRTVRHLGAVAAGMAPILLWSAFATLYYGSPLPNTAFAKLANGYPLIERIGQGGLYALHLCRHDPVSAGLVAIVPVLMLLQRTRVALAVGGGAMLHFAYIIWAGGDFMGGRLFTPVIFSACILLALEARDRWTAPAAILVFLLGLLSPYAPLRSGPDYTRMKPWKGIVDERGFYWEGAGLPSRLRGELHPFARQGRRLAGTKRTKMRAAAGLFGYHAGPSVHLVDPLGLGEPLLARLPARFDPNWRVGHYRRAVPKGYDPGVGAAPEHPDLQPLWTAVRSVTRDPVLSSGRLAQLWAFHVLRPTVFELRFPDLQPLRAPGKVERRGVRAGRLQAISSARGDKWAVVWLREEKVLRVERVVTTSEWTALDPPPEADEVLLFPVNHRDRGQRIRGVR